MHFHDITDHEVTKFWLDFLQNKGAIPIIVKRHFPMFEIPQDFSVFVDIDGVIRFDELILIVGVMFGFGVYLFAVVLMDDAG